MLRIWRDFLATGGYLLLAPISFQFDAPGIRTAGLLAIFVLALTAWLLSLRRLRAIRDTPTSRIASAAQGYAELTGKGRPMPGQEILSPARNLPCLWYRYRRFKRSGEDNWRQIDSGESDTPFILDDGTGRCLLDPVGAEILTDRKDSYQEDGYRLDEELLLIDAPIYALGEFRSQHGLFDERTELGNVLEDWKQDQDDLLRRFDLNGNGEIEPQEWQLARAAAQREVDARRQAATDAPISHALIRPRSGRPFLIACFPPEQLTRRYRWRVWVHFTL
ncbi:MAG: GIDE domain-containing protein, partial [Parasulfuritortus sp.]|nr:GIDE domain-containing protein [Parasulfuritortus sp.]